MWFVMCALLWRSSVLDAVKRDELEMRWRDVPAPSILGSRFRNWLTHGDIRYLELKKPSSKDGISNQEEREGRMGAGDTVDL